MVQRFAGFGAFGRSRLGPCSEHPRITFGAGPLARTRASRRIVAGAALLQGGRSSFVGADVVGAAFSQASLLRPLFVALLCVAFVSLLHLVHCPCCPAAQDMSVLLFFVPPIGWLESGA